MIKVKAKSAIIALAIRSIFNEEIDYLYQNICVILNFKWYYIIQSCESVKKNTYNPQCLAFYSDRV